MVNHNKSVSLDYNDTDMVKVNPPPEALCWRRCGVLRIKITSLFNNNR